MALILSPEDPTLIEAVARAICTDQDEPCWEAHTIQAQEVIRALVALTIANRGEEAPDAL